MPDSSPDIRNVPEIKIKEFWQKVPHKSFPLELLDLIGYFDTPKDAYIRDENGTIRYGYIGRDENGRLNARGEIIIAPPMTREENEQFDFMTKRLNMVKIALTIINEEDNPEEFELERKRLSRKYIHMYAAFASLIDRLRMRALSMALREFDSSVTREKMMILERVREASNE